MIDTLITKGILPDPIIRFGIKKLLKNRIDEISSKDVEKKDQDRLRLIHELQTGPIAIQTDLANDQHYQLPPDFFKLALGPNLKYSCAYFDQKTQHLGEAEMAMLEITCQRAELIDGQDILELGCGWGSLTLYMAKKFPNSKIKAISNAANQRQYIEAEVKKHNLNNVEVITQNVINFETADRFDRVVSVEMFEHMRNHQILINRIATWLKENGKLFIHIFVHRDVTYKFEVKDETDWMSKYFFSGGIMPSEHYLYYLKLDLSLTKHWRVSGTHYAKTSRAWLKNMDAQIDEVKKIFSKHYGKENAERWINYWRVFFMSCEELWNYNDGTEWFVSHYLLEKK